MSGFARATFAVLLGVSVLSATLPTFAEAQSVSVSIGTNLNHGRRITCVQGERILRARGFWNVRRIRCGGNFFVYRGRRHNGLFEITLRSWDGRVTNIRRIGW